MFRKHIFETSKVYTASKEKQLLGIEELAPHTDATIAIFQTIAAVYIGGASIVELKTLEEGYKKENKRMDHINKNMIKVFNMQNASGKQDDKLGP